MHVRSESPLLYFGTPVVLISTLNEDHGRFKIDKVGELVFVARS
jgi:hypothetical protein